MSYTSVENYCIIYQSIAHEKVFWLHIQNRSNSCFVQRGHSMVVQHKFTSPSPVVVWELVMPLIRAEHIESVENSLQTLELFTVEAWNGPGSFDINSEWKKCCRLKYFDIVRLQRQAWGSHQLCKTASYYFPHTNEFTYKWLPLFTPAIEAIKAMCQLSKKGLGVVPDGTPMTFNSLILTAVHMHFHLSVELDNHTYSRNPCLSIIMILGCVE